jgi:hypothetical protein
MRTLGEVIMIVAVLALLVVSCAAGYSPQYNRPLRELFRPLEWPFRRTSYLTFFEEHSAWTVFLPLFLVLGVGWVLRRYG